MTDNAIQKQEAGALAQPSPQSDAAMFLAIIEKVASNPDVDVDKMQKILEMQEKVLDRNAEQAYNESFMRVQSNLPTIPFDSINKNTSSRYAKLGQILKYATPIYTAEGFSISCYEGDTSKEKHIRIMGDVMHKAGHTKPLHVDLPIDICGIAGKRNKTDLHGTGSTFSYGRRYLTCLAFNIPTGEDDDGQAAGAAPKPTIPEPKGQEVEFLDEVFQHIRDENAPDGQKITKAAMQAFIYSAWRKWPTEFAKAPDCAAYIRKKGIHNVCEMIQCNES